MLVVDGQIVAIDEAQAREMVDEVSEVLGNKTELESTGEETAIAAICKLHNNLGGLALSCDNGVVSATLDKSVMTTTLLDEEIITLDGLNTKLTKLENDIANAYDICVSNGITPKDKTIASIVEALINK